VRSVRFAELTEALCGNVSVDAILAAFAEPVEKGEVMARQTAIDQLFAGASIEEILAAVEDVAKMDGGGTAWAAKIAAIMRGKSPTSLRIALQQMRRGKNWSFEECMQAEFRIVSRVIREHDFYEGVRAVIVDKDNKPRWRPATLAEVTPAMVEAHFAPLAEELPL
jgi:enoyl-CoA hydratase